MRQDSFFLAFLLLVVVLLVKTSESLAACPQNESGLILFDSLPNTNTLNGSVTVKSSVKMSTSPPYKLRSITVESGGKLIFDDVNLSLKVDFIRVESGGYFIMGSETCPITNKIVISVFGDRVLSNVSDIGKDPADNAQCGSKGIAFLSGSFVSVFGWVSGPSWTELSTTSLKGSNSIQVVQNVSWSVGDSIVVASTDFGEVTTTTKKSLAWMKGTPFPDMNEQRVIVGISSDKRTIFLDKPLNFTHYSNGLNMRAEVGLLSRRIVFQGDESSDSTSFGGHLFIRLVSQFKFQGVEITRFGQFGLMGRYSLHFHLLGNTASAYPLGTEYFVKDCSVHHSYQRCYVVHDTNGILLENNVCFDNNGHSFFLEDGSETGNVFKNNLGIRPRPVPRETTDRILIPTDADVSVFWITNPNNTFIGNHAVGGKFSFWFTFAENPTGLSAKKYPAGTITPRSTPLKLFKDNVGHGAISGLFVDEMLNADGTTDTTGYNIKTPAVFDGFVGYKNRNFGIWIRGGVFYFPNCYLSDNSKGMGGAPGPHYISNTTFIGESDNAGDYSFRPSVDVGFRSRHYLTTTTEPLKGYTTYDNGGPHYLKNVTFVNFKPDQYRPAGAISMAENYYKLHTRSRFMNLKFINSNRVYMNSSIDNFKGAALYDVDGSTTGFQQGGWIVGTDSALLFDGCIRRDEWNASVCPNFGESYAQLRIFNTEASTMETQSNDGIDHPELLDRDQKITRAIFVDLLRNVETNVIGAFDQPEFTQHIPINLPTRGMYALKWPYNIPTPSYLKCTFEGSAADDWIILAVQYPLNTDFDITYVINGVTNSLLPGDSMVDIVIDRRNKYFYNNQTQHLYIRIQNFNDRSWFSEIDTFTDFRSYGTLIISASCTNSTCMPTVFGAPSTVLSKRFYKFNAREDRFVGRMEQCQQSAIAPLATNSTVGEGVIYAFLDINSGVVSFTLTHNLSDIATKVEIGIGSQGVEERIISSSKISSNSYSKFGLQLSITEWGEILKGNMFVKLSTSENPNGHLRGQLYCSTITDYSAHSCHQPPKYSTSTPCASMDGIPTLNIYTEGNTFVTDWSLSPMGSPDTFNVNYSSSPICESTSLYTSISTGMLYFKKKTGKLNIDTSTYKYLEFFVTTIDSGSVDLIFKVGNFSKDFCKLSITSKYIQHLKIDDTVTTRVRIPIEDLNLPISDPNIQKIVIYLADTTISKQLLIDNMRFIGESTEILSRKTFFADFKYFGNSSVCGVNTSNPDTDPLKIRKL